MTPSRRDFLGTSLAAGAALSAPTVHAATKADKRYKTALIGCGWWGTNIGREAVASGACELVAMCDVDDSQLAKSLADLSRKTIDQPRKYRDFRELIAREKPEIVIIATPDHWHPLIMIEAVKAGAHVYLEKPISHTVDEGKAMVKAVRDTGRVVQVDTHRRISPHNVSGMKFLKEGKAGKIGLVRAFIHYGQTGETPENNEEPPKTLDWDMWCGPAPLRPFNRKIHPKGFRDFMDYSNSTIADWGIHWLDQILWWTDEKGPRKVYSTGGRPVAGPAINDGVRQTTDSPDHQIAAYEFEGFSVSWENRRFGGNGAERTNPEHAVGCYFFGSEGTFHMGWLDGWTFYPANSKKAVVHQDAQLHGPDGQNIRELFADFLDCVKTGRRPVCDIETAHRSTTMSLLGVLSHKLGRSIDWDIDKELIVDDSEANKLLRRDYRKPWVYPT